MACIGHLSLNDRPRAVHRLVSPEWLELTSVDGRSVVGLTAAGASGWAETLAFCTADPYPGYVGEARAACVATWVWWFEGGITRRAELLFGVSGASLLYDAASFMHPLGEVSASAKPAVPSLHRLRGSTIDHEGLHLALCESASAKLDYWSWLACVTYAHGFPPIASVAYDTLPAAHHADPWTPVADGTVERQGANECHARFDRARFHNGALQQLAFAEQICVDWALTHGYSLHPWLQSSPIARMEPHIDDVHPKCVARDATTARTEPPANLSLASAGADRAARGSCELIKPVARHDHQQAVCGATKPHRHDWRAHERPLR
jgi:hypothetical protein